MIDVLFGYSSKTDDVKEYERELRLRRRRLRIEEKAKRQLETTGHQSNNEE